MPSVTTENSNRSMAQVEQITLSERDSLRVLEVLENPPAPNARLLAAAQALPVKL